MTFARSLTHNLGAKVLAVIVALLVWFNASGQQEVIRVRTASIVLTGLPDSLAVANLVAPSAEVRISASRRQLVSIGFRKLQVAVDLSGLGAGRQRIPLSGHNVHGAGSIAPANIQVVSPQLLQVDLEPVETRRLRVSLSTAGSLPENMVMLEPGVTIEPAWVTVRGAASALERVQHVSTEPVDLSHLHETTTRDVALSCDPHALSCDPPRVSVTLRVSERGERVLANVPPTVLLDSPDLDAEVHPATVSLTIEGPSAVLDTLSSGDVSVLVELAGKTRATYRLVPTVILPPGLHLSKISADTLDVRVIRGGH